MTFCLKERVKRIIKCFVSQKRKEVSMHKVVVIGANGKMGKIVQEAISLMNDFSLVAEVNRGDDLENILKLHKPAIAIDVSSHSVVKQNAWTILKNGARPVVGASGLSLIELEELVSYCKDKKLGGLVIPNFSIAFAFINKVTKEFSEFYEDISIVEFHHAQKKDKPSGTARYTAKIANIDENQIASVRSNGFLAKQQIYINSESERIVIDHESFSRKSFIKGIQLSLNKVLKLDTMLVGLENAL